MRHPAVKSSPHEADPEDRSTGVARAAIEWAMLGRRSVRGFHPTPIDRKIIERILEIASRAPSGSNMQPWKVHVLTGRALDRLKAEMIAFHETGAPATREYEYYPVEWRSPYIERRRKVGWDLFALAGVGRGDRAGSERQRGKNYAFFGAPVGMIFTIDRDLGQGSWLDYGMFLQSIMIAARGHGLDTCPQAALANFPEIVRRHLAIPETELVLCGMAVGLKDPGEPTNQLVAEREPVASFTTFHDA
jgi:nitroreductase